MRHGASPRERGLGGRAFADGIADNQFALEGWRRRDGFTLQSAQQFFKCIADHLGDGHMHGSEGRVEP